MSDHAEAQALAGSMAPLKFADDLMADWLKAMDSGRYKFGCGLLRDEADRYDPLGVLADINEVEWTFDDEEGAWAVDGDVAALNTERMREFFGLQPRTTPGQIDRFERQLITLTDQSTKFSQITSVLRLATVISKKTRDIAERVSRTGRDEHLGMRIIDDDEPNRVAYGRQALWRY